MIQIQYVVKAIRHRLELCGDENLSGSVDDYLSGQTHVGLAATETCAKPIPLI